MLVVGLSFLGCAALHSVQVGTIDNRNSHKHEQFPFEVMVSETGVSFEDIGQIGNAVGGEAGKNTSSIAEIVSYFQMGPRAGNPVYFSRYAEGLVKEIRKRCPSGKITGLVSIRETMKYPVISGEIVKVRGICQSAKKIAKVEGDLK